MTAFNIFSPRSVRHRVSAARPGRPSRVVRHSLQGQAAAAAFGTRAPAQRVGRGRSVVQGQTGRGVAFLVSRAAASRGRWAARRADGNAGLEFDPERELLPRLPRGEVRVGGTCSVLLGRCFSPEMGTVVYRFRWKDTCICCPLVHRSISSIKLRSKIQMTLIVPFQKIAELTYRSSAGQLPGKAGCSCGNDKLTSCATVRHASIRGQVSEVKTDT